MNFSLDFRAVSQSENVDELLTREQSHWLARHVIEGYTTDRNSRTGWEKTYENAHKLALQVTESKTWPWEGAANVKFPLLTVATLQFSARAYSALIRPQGLVRCKVVGADPGGAKKARADRVCAHMSWQMLEQDEGWEEEHDKALMAAPIVGCSFIKTWYDPVKRHNCSQHVLAWDLVINYFARSLESADRITHVFYLYEREIRERQNLGIYSPVDISLPPETEKRPADERQGITPPVWDARTPRRILEQHLYLDLDGDGYEEPYVATVEEFSTRLLRLVPRFGEVVTRQSLQARSLMNQLNDPSVVTAAMIEQVQARATALENETPDIISITPMCYFTKLPFVPSPDGGFYELGFGALLGPINEAVNTIVNQLIDAGTLANLQGGFIGRGARIRGGQVRFKPGEWKRVDVAGSTLRDAIVPLPATQPSSVLYNMLGLLIGYGERIASVNEVSSGENVGQNTPAYNMQAMLQQGMAVFSGIFKRLYRAFRDEYRLWYRLNRRYLAAEEYFQVMDGPGREIYRTDYLGDPSDISPCADPNAVLNDEKMRQAMLLANRAQAVPGYNLPVVEQRILEAAGIADIGQVYPVDERGNPLIAPPPNPEFEIQRLSEQRLTLQMKNEDERADAVARAQIAEIEARTIKTLAEAGALDEQTRTDRMAVILKAFDIERARNEQSQASGESSRSRAAGVAAKSGNGSVSWTG